MKYDGIVIGGGAAGMFAAITAAKQGSNVLLLERNDRLGKKLLITGKGRCNLTNACTAQEVLNNIPRNNKFLYSAMNAFPPTNTMDFFESIGCRLKIERGNRVFPQSDRSASVLNALKNELNTAGVNCAVRRVSQISVIDNAVTGVKTERGDYFADWVILATGGVSYPSTGSTGDGYEMAMQLGHTIVAPEGSLVPLQTKGDICQRMQGLSLRNIGIKLLDSKGKVFYKDFGELLFTHFGVSGPVILSASAHLKGTDCKLLIDLKPALDNARLDARLLRDLAQYQNRSIENALIDILPSSMIPVLLDMAGIDASLQANALRKEQRSMLLSLMKAFPVLITGKRPLEEAIITSGGIKVSEINPKTMGSKLVSGLYFAGEIIDCDAYTGGFNLQIAWATAYTAAMAAKNRD